MAEPTIKVVVIDDDKPIRRFVRLSLEGCGMTVLEAQTGRQGLMLTETQCPDVVIADVDLVDLDGDDVIGLLRDRSNAWLIVLSARSREAEKVAALDAGADDYLTKPFGMPELIARIRAHFRRQSSEGSCGGPIVRFGGVLVNLAKRQVLRDGSPVHLSPTEYRVLSALVHHAGYVVIHEKLLREVWGRTHPRDHHYLRIYMAHLRNKLERDPSHPEHIVTEPGMGYRLVDAHEIAEESNPEDVKSLTQKRGAV